jgi:hypothetical protein
LKSIRVPSLSDEANLLPGSGKNSAACGTGAPELSTTPRFTIVGGGNVTFSIRFPVSVIDAVPAKFVTLSVDQSTWNLYRPAATRSSTNRSRTTKAANLLIPAAMPANYRR